MKPTRKVLIEGLIGEDLTEMVILVEQARQEREDKEARETAARSGDPIGTIRYDEAQSNLWVRTCGWRWDVYPADDHGLDVPDHAVPWSTFPIVGMMPQPWVNEHVKWHHEDYEETP